MKNPIRQRVSTSATVSGKDASTQARDIADALDQMAQVMKISYTGLVQFPITLQVPQAPYAVIAVRIVQSINKQSVAPQGGFCSFAYDAGAGVASVTAINAFIASSGAPLPANALYDFSFLAVF